MEQLELELHYYTFPFFLQDHGGPQLSCPSFTPCPRPETQAYQCGFPQDPQNSQQHHAEPAFPLCRAPQPHSGAACTGLRSPILLPYLIHPSPCPPAHFTSKHYCQPHALQQGWAAAPDAQWHNIYHNYKRASLHVWILVHLLQPGQSEL